VFLATYCGGEESIYGIHFWHGNLPLETNKMRGKIQVCPDPAPNNGGKINANI
jgi:hypothetical protein